MTIKFEQMDQIPEMTEEQSKFNEYLNDLVDKLPLHPKPLYEYTEEEKKKYEYTGDMEDKNRRMKEKLYNLWKFWAEIRSSKIIEDLLFRKPEDLESDEYLAKQIIVNIIDQLGKIMTNTNLIEEVFF